jgi:hypothetical protein
MALILRDWFGFDLDDESPVALRHRDRQPCPFIGGACTKSFNDGTLSGVCTVSTSTERAPVIICPNRLYAGNYAVLGDVTTIAFGPGHQVIHPNEA